MTLASGPGKPKNEMKCDTCGKKGYTKDRCWQTYPHLKRSPQELQAARNKPKVELTKNETTRKVLAVATTDLTQFNRRLSDMRCILCDRKGHTKQNCLLAHSGQNKSERLLCTSTSKPFRRCKTPSSEPTDTRIDSQSQRREKPIVSGVIEVEEGGYIGGSGNTGMGGKSGVQGAFSRPSHSFTTKKGVEIRAPDDFVPHSLNPTCMMLLGNDSTSMEQDK